VLLDVWDRALDLGGILGGVSLAVVVVGDAEGFRGRWNDMGEYLGSCEGPKTSSSGFGWSRAGGGGVIMSKCGRIGESSPLGIYMLSSRGLNEIGRGRGRGRGGGVRPTCLRLVY